MLTEQQRTDLLSRIEQVAQQAPTPQYNLLFEGSEDPSKGEAWVRHSRHDYNLRLQAAMALALRIGVEHVLISPLRSTLHDPLYVDCDLAFEVRCASAVSGNPDRPQWHCLGVQRNIFGSNPNWWWNPNRCFRIINTLIDDYVKG